MNNLLLNYIRGIIDILVYLPNMLKEKKYIASITDDNTSEAYRQFLFETSENFDYYWHTELSKERPIGNEDYEEFARRIAEMAYIQGVEDGQR